MDLTQASINKYKHALTIIAKTNKMLNKIKNNMDITKNAQSDAESNCKYNSINKYKHALTVIAKTNKMLDKIKNNMDITKNAQSDAESDCKYDSIIEMLLLNPNIKYR